MSDKIAIVTGANKGVGFEVVKGLCEKFDGKVYLTSRDESRGKAACEKLKKLGLNPCYHQLDVTDQNSVLKFRDHIKNEHGFVDILINNAAVKFLLDATEPKLFQAEQTLQANFFGLVNFTEELLPLMRTGGRIINVSSASAHLSRIPSEDFRKKLQDPELTVDELKRFITSYVDAVKVGKDIEEGWGDSPYIVSKNAVNAYSFLLNRILANRGILVNCPHPGYVQSDMTRGTGDRSPAKGAEVVFKALEAKEGGLYLWHNGAPVTWDGPDPRGYLDGVEMNKFNGIEPTI